MKQTTSSKVRNPRGNYKGTKHSHHQSWSKTLKKNDFVRNLFRDRISPVVGLTNREIVSILFAIPKAKSESMNNRTLEEYMEQFRVIKKRLRQSGVMAIVSTQMSIGTILNDTGLPSAQGRRVLEKRTFIHHRCTDLNIAKDYRKRMNDVAKGVVEAGVQTEEITDKIITELRVLNELKVTR